MDGDKYMNYCTHCGNQLNNNQNYCTKCGMFVGNNNQKQTPVNTQKQHEKSKKQAIFSFILSVIPIILILYCLITSKGSVSEDGEGAVWWLLIMYYWTLGFPLLITSVILSISSIKTKNNVLAYISLLISALPFIALALLIIISSI